MVRANSNNKGTNSHHTFGTNHRWKKKKNNNDDDPNDTIRKKWLPPQTTSPQILTTAAIPNLTKICLKTFFFTTVGLYILNQKHLLPKPLGRVVSKALFWPTLPITVSRRIGKWSTEIDDVVMLGGAPFGFMGIPERLYEEHGIRAVVNLCDEYRGPMQKYDKLGMKQLWLRTVDHFEPSLQDIKKAVAFIEQNQSQGNRVYIHCRAGHGRSAAIVFAWLLSKDPHYQNPEKLNEYFCSLRNVRKSLWKQPNIKAYHSWLKKGDDYDFKMKRGGDFAERYVREGYDVDHTHDNDDSELTSDNDF